MGLEVTVHVIGKYFLKDLSSKYFLKDFVNEFGNVVTLTLMGD